ncbi:MAG: two-component system response regulator [Ktedonobacterales bacterium]
MTGEQNVRVLIVDDDTAIRQTLRSALEEEAYTVLEAGEGRAALRLLRESAEPLVTLLDLRMPVMDGESVLRAVEADPPLARRHAFVVVTANQEALTPASVAMLVRLGVPVVAKPFDLDDLLRVVETASYRLGPHSSDSGIFHGNPQR